MVLANVYFHALPEEDDYEVHDERAYSGGCDGCVPAYIVRRADYDTLRAENAELVAAIERLSTPSGLTAYGEALANAIDVLAKHRGE